MLEKKAMEVVQGVKPNIISWISAVIGAALVWWTGLPPLGQALLIVQGADVLTGLLCAVTGKSKKTERSYAYAIRVLVDVRGSIPRKNSVLSGWLSAFA